MSSPYTFFQLIEPKGRKPQIVWSSVKQLSFLYIGVEKNPWLWLQIPEKSHNTTCNTPLILNYHYYTSQHHPLKSSHRLFQKDKLSNSKFVFSYINNWKFSWHFIMIIQYLNIVKEESLISEIHDWIFFIRKYTSLCTSLVISLRLHS